MDSYKYSFQSPLNIDDILFILKGLKAETTLREKGFSHFSIVSAPVYEFTISALPVLDILLPVKGIIIQKNNHCEVELTIEHGGKTFFQLMEHSNFYFFNMVLSFILPVVGIVFFVRNGTISFETLMILWAIFFAGTIVISAYQVKTSYERYAQYLAEKLSKMPEIDAHIQELIHQIGEKKS